MNIETTLDLENSGNVSQDCSSIYNISKLLDEAKRKPNLNLRIISKSSLVLLLLPALIALKDRIRIELVFDDERNINLLDENISGEKTKKFKELLEANSILSKAGIDVMFSKKLSI